MKKRMVIFASGSGTNTQNIIQYFQKKEEAEVVLVVSNRKEAQVLQRAKALNVNTQYISKESFIASEALVKQLKDLSPDLIILAGFLLKFPLAVLEAFPEKVINIHPALLPKFGGKGMYGAHVHQAVIDQKEAETGITVHYVTENYDEGAIIFQKSVPVSENDTPVTVAEKVHQLEYEYFPQVIEKVLQQQEKE